MRKLIFLLLMVSPAIAQENDPFAELVVTSPEIAAAQAERDAAAAHLRAARGGFLPQLRVEGQAGTLEETLRINGLPEEFTGSRDPNSVAAILDQALFTSGRLSGAIGGAAAQRDAARATADATRQDIILAGVIVTADLVRDRRILTVRERNEVLAQGRLTETQSRRNAGLATITDLKQAEARASFAKAEHLAAAGAVQRAEAAYSRVFGEPAAATLTMPMTPQTLPVTLKDALDRAVQANPDLASAADRARASKFAVREARGARLPQIRLQARASYAEGERIGEVLGEAEQYGIFITGRMNIWSGGSLDAQIRSAKARASATRHQLTATHRQIREQTISAFSDTETAASVLAARDSQVNAARAVQNGVVREFDVGRRTRLDVLDADLELANAEVARLQATRDLLVSQYALLRSMGAI